MATQLAGKEIASSGWVPRFLINVDIHKLRGTNYKASNLLSAGWPHFALPSFSCPLCGIARTSIIASSSMPPNHRHDLRHWGMLTA